MTWRGPHPMLLLVLLATWLALARGETRFGKFQRQHVDRPRTRGESDRVYCNRMMTTRSMTSPKCKRINTFIHVNNVNPITDICGSAVTPADDNLRDSKDPFALTICELGKGSQTPPCDYNGYSDYQRIRIACERGLPVHYNQTI